MPRDHTPIEIHTTCTCCATNPIACSRFQHRSSTPQLVQLLQSARRCGRCRTSSGLPVHAQRWPESIAAAEPVDSTSFVPLPTSSRLYHGHLVVMSLPHLRLTGIQRRCTQCSTANVVYYINVVLLADEVHVSAPCPCLPETTRIPLKSRVHWSTRKNLPHCTAKGSPIVPLVRFEIGSSYAYHPR